MGIFDWLKSEPKPKKTRQKKERKSFDIGDFLTRHTRKTLTKLARDDPDAIDRMIIADLESKRGWKLPKDKPKDALTDWLDMRDRLAKSGLTPDDDKGWLKDIAVVAGQVLLAVQQQQMQTNQNGMPVTNPNVGQIAGIGQAPALNPSAQEQEEVVSNYLISQFQRKTPKGAYSWITKQHHPQLDTLIQHIKQTDDTTLFPLLDVVAARNPILKGFIQWLKERPDWTKELAAIIRTAGQPADKVTSTGL